MEFFGIGVLFGLAGCGSSSSKGGTGAGAGNGSAPVTLTNCMSGDTTACNVFTTPTGTQIQLGPYGAVMEPNVGKGFENAVASGDQPGNGATCQAFAAIFMEDPKLTAKLLDVTTNNLDFALYTVYRPANWPSGPVPIITWGNGTCAQPEGYGALLRYVASYGFFIVAANNRFVGSATEMLHALDFAAAANMDSTSPYYRKLDTTKMGAMGHSQGAAGTANAANDSRVQDVILFNGGGSASKPFLALSGDMDIANATPASMASAVNAAPKAAWLYYHNPAGMGSIRGHLVLMLTPDRVEVPTVAWWRMIFQNDADSRGQFVGSSCGLCNHSSDYEFGEHGLD